MLYRKIEEKIENYLKSNSNKVLIVDGARQIGKTFIIRDACKKMFSNYIEINLLQDKQGLKTFENVNTVEDFYLQISMTHGNLLKEKDNTIIFLDEIQCYPNLITLLKFLKEDNRYNYIASGSLLGVTLADTLSIPIGSIEILKMYPLDFEEFLIANGFNSLAINSLRESYKNRKSLSTENHNKMMDLFKKYLLVGGLPDAVNTYLKDKNIVNIRNIQNDIISLYKQDASNYDKKRKLKIQRIYEMIPSNLENKKKRIIIQEIENKRGKSYEEYLDEFDYLINAGIALEVKAISTPTFPLIEISSKNLLKLYLNDVGLLTNILYKNNIRAILDNKNSINLGSVYESVVASELSAHGHNLFYYDNKKNGEVDFLIDDYDNLSVLPIEVKSGKDYKIHSAIEKFLANKDYSTKEGIVLSNNKDIYYEDGILYLPIYYIMFI